MELGVQLAVIPVDEYAALLIAGNDLQAVELLGGAAERGKFGYRGFEYPASTASRMALLRGSMSGTLTYVPSP